MSDDPIRKPLGWPEATTAETYGPPERKWQVWFVFALFFWLAMFALSYVTVTVVYAIRGCQS